METGTYVECSLSNSMNKRKYIVLQIFTSTFSECNCLTERIDALHVFNKRQ